MLPFRETRFSTIFLSLFFLGIVGYAYFESRALLFGPAISTPEGQTVVHDPLIVVKGTASNIASLFMNGKQIPVSESGAFESPYVLYTGYNRISLSAIDKYNKRTEKIIEVLYEPLLIEPVSSSTPSLAPIP